MGDTPDKFPKDKDTKQKPEKKKRGTRMMGAAPPSDWSTPDKQPSLPNPMMPGPAPDDEPKRTLMMGAVDEEKPVAPKPQPPKQQRTKPQPQKPQPQMPRQSARPQKTMLMDADAIARLNEEQPQSTSGQQAPVQPGSIRRTSRKPPTPAPQQQAKPQPAMPSAPQPNRAQPQPGMPSPTRRPKGTMMYDAARDDKAMADEPAPAPTIEQTPEATAGARMQQDAAVAGPKMTLLFAPTATGKETPAEDTSPVKSCLKCGTEIDREAPYCPACFTKHGIPEHGRAWGGMAKAVWKSPKGKAAVITAGHIIGFSIYFLVVILANSIPTEGSVNGRFAAALALYWDGNPEQAMDEFGELQEEDGGFWSWLYDFKPGEPAYFSGRCALNLGKSTNARTSFTNAIGQAPDDIRYHEAYRALWMMSHGDLASFVEEYQTRFDPEKPGAQYVLGRVALDMGEMTTAKERLEDLQTLKQDSPFAAILEGVYLAQQGDSDKAASLLSSITSPTLATYISRIELARLALASDNAKGATIPITKALEVDARWPDAFEMAGRVYMDIEDYEGAQRAFATASSLAPAWDIPRIGLARLALAQKDYKTCTEMVESALKVYPEGLEARLVQMQMFIVQDDVQQAKDLSKKLVREFSKDYRSHVARGEYYLMRHDFSEAAKAFEKAVKVQPKYAQGYAKLGELYSVLGRTRKAEKRMRKAVEYEPQNLAFRRALGMVLINTEKYEAAKQLYEGMLKKDFENADLWIDYGDVLSAGEYYQEARKVFEKALKVRADSIDGMLRLANTYEALKMTIPAGNQYESALKTAPENMDVYKRYIGYILRHASVDRAKVVVRNAINAMPKSPEPHLLMAEVCKQYDEWDRAEDHIQQAIRLAPKRGDLYNQLAVMYFQRRDMKRAMATVNAALGEFTEESSLHRFKGLLLLDKRKFSQARKSLAKALELDRHDPENFAALGRYYLVVGPAKRAVANFGRAIERAPTRADLYMKRADAHKKAKGPNWKWHMKRDLRKACERDRSFCKRRKR